MRPPTKRLDADTYASSMAHVCCALIHIISCKFSHDIKGYLLSKPRDLHFPVQPQASSSLVGLEPDEQAAYLDAHYTTTQPFIRWSIGEGEGASQQEDEDVPQPACRSIDDTLSVHTRCPSYDAHRAKRGGSGTDTCPAGWKCRFLGAHIRRTSATQSASSPDGLEEFALLRFEPSAAPSACKSKPRVAPDERNYPSTESVRSLARKKVSSLW